MRILGFDKGETQELNTMSCDIKHHIKTSKLLYYP